MKILKKLLENEVQSYIEAHLNADAGRMLLKKSPFVGIQMRDLVGQIQSRKKAQLKLPTWFAARGVLFPPLLHLEQSSSEIAARFKAAMLQGNRLADLTGGLGVDAFFWSESFAQVDYVERNESLAAIAAHNFGVLGKHNIAIHTVDALEWLNQTKITWDAVYMDPARRDKAGNKVFRLSDCQPDLSAVLPLLIGRTQQVLIKTSPLLDISAAMTELEHAGHWQVAAVTVLAVQNECKEVLYQLQPVGAAQSLQIRAVNLTEGAVQDVAFTPRDEHAASVELGAPQAFFCEPNAALLKAGAFKTVAHRWGLRKLHPHTHIYTCAERPANFPGRVFRLKAVCKADRKALRACLPEGIAHLAVRNFPSTVAELRKRWGIAEGGNLYLFAVTLADGQKAVLIGEKD